MKVLAADKMTDAFADRLQRAGIEIVSDPALKGESLTQALRKHQPEVLVVRSTKVTADDILASDHLELIVRAGAGYDTIDVTTASNNGVFVANCPGKNATAVAELTMGLVLAMDRHLPDNVADARAGHWNKALYSKAKGLRGRVLGVVGLGSIGKEVVRLGSAFGMPVIAWSRSLTPERAADLGIRFAPTPADVASQADVVSVHVSSTPETKHLIDKSFFQRMKPGAYFVNTTRSAVVDEDALQWALEERDVRAAIDVMEGEPASKEGDFQHPLARHPNLYISHHIGASTEQAQEAIAAEAARVIITYHDDGEVPNCVNLADHTPATHQLTVRHKDRVGVLARVLNEVRKADWNVQEMENVVFAGAEAACARIRFAGLPDNSTVRDIQALDDVLAVSLLQLED